MPRAKKQELTQRKDGRYCCRYKDKWFMGKSDTEALQKRKDYIDKERQGAYTGKYPLVSDYSIKWLALHKSGVSVKCYNDYAKQIEALFPVIGAKKINEVTVDDAAAVWQHFQGYSASTIKRARMLYIAIFDTAIENDLCRKNPFRGRYAQPPKGPSGSHRVLTDEEIHLVQTVPHRMQLAAMIMLYAGLRRGEVLALTPEDINLKTNTIRVSKAIRFDGNKPILSATKTSAGNRSVPILDVLRPFLEELNQRPACMINGDIMTDTSFRRAWDSYNFHLSKAAGHLIEIRPHDLRHTYCTTLRDAGVDMHQAMLWMGHADEKMILHIYDHITDQRTQTSTDKVNRMLSSRQNGRQAP